jgi:hypothetical protein
MPPNKPQSNYSKTPVKRIRILKIGPRKGKSLFEEYFYGFLVAICLAVMILGKAGGLSGYDAVVTGLWVGGFVWCAWVLRRYQKEKASPRQMARSKPAVQTRPQAMAKPFSNMKPVMGPQWGMKTPPGVRPVAAPQATQTPTPPEKKRAFVYERPTLPNRPPKFPANWAGQPDKKPKR